MTSINRLLFLKNYNLSVQSAANMLHDLFAYQWHISFIFFSRMIFWKDKASIVECLCRQEGATSERDKQKELSGRPAPENKKEGLQKWRGEGKKRTGKRQAASGVQSI